MTATNDVGTSGSSAPITVPFVDTVAPELTCTGPLSLTVEIPVGEEDVPFVWSPDTSSACTWDDNHDDPALLTHILEDMLSFDRFTPPCDAEGSECLRLVPGTYTFEYWVEDSEDLPSSHISLTVSVTYAPAVANCMLIDAREDLSVHDQEKGTYSVVPTIWCTGEVGATFEIYNERTGVCGGPVTIGSSREATVTVDSPGCV